MLSWLEQVQKFFEGWYYKIISADQKHALAIIPGIAMDEHGTKQALFRYWMAETSKLLITNLMLKTLSQIQKSMI